MLDFRAWLLRPVLEKLNHLKALHMTTTLETVATIEALAAQVAKSRAEVVAKIQALEDALAAESVTAPAIVEALAALKSEVQTTDDLVPDATPVDPLA